MKMVNCQSIKLLRFKDSILGDSVVDWSYYYTTLSNFEYMESSGLGIDV